MRALVTTAPRTMELRDVPTPSVPGPGEVLLQIEAAGVCGSDYHLYLGDHPYSNFPLIQGHEMCGRLAAHGPECLGTLPTGCRVAVEPLRPCGTCYPCSRGRYNCCTNLQIIGVHRPGAFQELLCVPEGLAHDATGLSAMLTAFVEPMTIALQAIKRAAVGPEDSVLVLGVGPIGQAILLSARSRGARVAVHDLVEPRLERSLAIGAEIAVSGPGNVEDAMRQWTGGIGPTVIVDTTGAPAVIRRAYDLVAAAGRIVLVGISNRDVSVPVISYSRKELSVFGSRNSVDMFPKAIALIHSIQREVEMVITHNITLLEIPDVIELALAKPEIMEKAVVHF